MKKIFTIIFVCIQTIASAQFLTQSAEGKSSVPLPLNGLGLSVDIGKSEVVLGLNNYKKVLDSDSPRWLYGAMLSGKSSDGLASLFRNGEIVPEGNLLAFFGRSWSNDAKVGNAFDASYKPNRTKRFVKERDDLFLAYKTAVIQTISLTTVKIEDAVNRADVESELLDSVIAMEDNRSVTRFITTYKKDGEEYKSFHKALQDEHKKDLKIYVDSYNALKKEFDADIKKFDDEQTKKGGKKEARPIPWRVTGFLMGGIQARAFTRYLGLNTSDFSKSFQDTLFRGGSFGAGVNAHIGKFWLGVTYNYIAGDNFSNLKSKEYTLRTTDTTGNTTLISEKKTTAYPGKYSRVERNELNIDLIGEFRIADTARILVNPYLRSSLFSRDTAYLKNFTNIGLGLYFIGKKGKFIGGLYVELPDINNNTEKAKPANEINIREPHKKLSFGIVTKFNLSSMFKWGNREAKKD